MRLLRCRRSDRGSVTVEMAVVFPAVIALALLALQVAMVVHGRDVAAAAAGHALDRARVLNGSAEAGEATAHQFLDQAGDGLTDPTVAVSRGPEQVTATVTSHVVSLVPIWAPSIRVTMTAPVERTPDG